MRFHNRTDAGRQLAARLTEYGNRSDVIVLALPRGGVPVASEVAARLKAPLDVFLVRKLGVPGHPELAMGAIAVGGVQVLSNDVMISRRVHQRAIIASRCSRSSTGRQNPTYCDGSRDASALQVTVTARSSDVSGSATRS